MNIALGSLYSSGFWLGSHHAKIVEKAHADLLVRLPVLCPSDALGQEAPFSHHAQVPFLGTFGGGDAQAVRHFRLGPESIRTFGSVPRRFYRTPQSRQQTRGCPQDPHQRHCKVLDPVRDGLGEV